MLLSWCGWHVQVYAIFMKSLTRALRSIWSPWRNKRGATATTTEMVPRQHSGDPTTHLRYRCKGEVCGCVQKMVGHSRISGVPCVGGMATEGRARNKRARYEHGVQLVSHNIRPRWLSRRYTFEACVIGAVRVKRCSRSWSSWQVVVLSDGRGSSCSRFVVGSSRSRGDGSRSRS